MLTNKGMQEAWWVRAELRSLQTFIWNVTLLAHIYGKEMAECNENMNITGQKETESYHNFPANPSSNVFAVGIAQTLEDYFESSLKAQDYKVPPSQVPLLLQKVKNHLQKTYQQVGSGKKKN